MLLALIVGMAMFFADIGQGDYVLLLSAGRTKTAGLFDGLCDVFNSIAIVGAGSSFLTVISNHGSLHFSFHITLTTVLVNLALIIGSIGGAWASGYVGKWLYKKAAK